MKKALSLLFIFIFTFFTVFIDVNAKTLKDLKNELNDLIVKKNNQDNKKKLTQQEMKTINDRITKITALITTSENKIKDLNGEIVVLEEKSAKKEEEIKDIVSFLQVTNSNNAYLEYIFGAESITDLIFRSAVSEQLVAYNNDLIVEYNDTVKECQNKRTELKEEIVNLDTEQRNLKTELVKLGDSLNDIVEISVDIDTDISIQKKAIAYYEKTLGCKDNENILTCGNTGKIPYTGHLIRPIINGRITSGFGWRPYPFGGKPDFHNGIDIAGGSTTVYSAGPGVVAGIVWRYRCGGNMLYIHHNVNGIKYTTGYYHLYQVNVRVGDYVDQNTKIGIMGGNSLTPWDHCSTGTHLHFSVARGLYLKEYSSWNTYISKQVNPTSIVNFPPEGYWIRNRTAKY